MTARRYVVSVQPKCEAFAKVHLERQGFEVYCPMVDGVRRIDGHSYRMPVPMLPGYLIVRFDIDVDRWRSINGTRGVVKLLPLSSEFPQPIPDELIERWMASEVDGRVVLDEAVETLAQYQAGEPLRVLEGPFAGFIGTCISSSKVRVELLMGLFGRQTVVEVNPRNVKLA